MMFPRDALTAPADAKMIGLMQKIKGMTWASKEITRRRYEKFARLALIGGSCKVTAEAFPQLFKMLRELSEKLAIAVPEIYLRAGNRIAASLIGEEHPLLILSDATLTRLNERELYCLLAQTLTHIHCGHLPYLAMRDLTTAAADNLGILKSAVSFPRMLLEEWKYAAEMSGDRGALWVTGDLNLVLEFLCKLTLPENNQYGKLTPEQLLQQGELYLKTYAETPTCPVFHTWSNLYFQLPRYALRAIEIKKWANSAEYQALRTGNYDAATREQEMPAYWGAFADNPTAWESVDDEASTTDFLFGMSKLGWLRDGAKIVADNAGMLARTGFNAFANAASAFVGSFKK